jgi:hypothetical protein
MRPRCLTLTAACLLSCGSSASSPSGRAQLTLASSADYGCPGTGNVMTGDFDGDGQVDIALRGR